MKILAFTHRCLFKVLFHYYFKYYLHSQPSGGVNKQIDSDRNCKAQRGIPEVWRVEDLPRNNTVHYSYVNMIRGGTFPYKWE